MNKKGFQLSATMLVVIILGIVILGVGTNIFFKAYNRTLDIKDEVDTATQKRLEALLDDGSQVIIPVTSKEGERGDYVMFNLGVNNELGDTKEFKVVVAYEDSVIGEYTDVFEGYPGGACEVGKCGPLYDDKPFELLSNEQKYIPIRIIIPKKAVKGQYLFTVDVLYDDDVLYGTKQLLTVNVR